MGRALPSPALWAPELVLNFLPTSRPSLPPQLLLLNCCLFQEAFLRPIRNAYLTPETLGRFHSSCLITSCLTHLQPPGRALSLTYWVDEP